MTEQIISNTQVDRAGRLLRDWMINGGPDDLDDEPLSSAANVLIEYRLSFAAPLTAVESQLAPLVADVSFQAELAGRPKRAGAICAKLVRFPSMRLTQMDDIAKGAGAIL